MTVSCAVVALLALLLSSGSAMDPNFITTVRYRSNMRIKPFSIMPQPNYYFLDGATVSIAFGYVPRFDQLFVDYQGSYPITGRFDVDTGVLELSGEAPISEYAVAISSVVFLTTSESGADKQITFTFGKGSMYHSVTKHFYRYVYTPLAWEQAEAACSGTPYMGFMGYLATVTSADEMAQVGSKIKSSMWLGGNDVTSPNTWRWVAGPEGTDDAGEGLSFWQGLSVYDGGSTPNSLRYASWYRFQPDNGDGRGQSYLSLLPTSEQGVSYFDDSSNTDGVTGYICEYGGMDSANVTATAWQFTDSTQLLFDCRLLDTATECANRAELGCAWITSSCQTSSCARHATQHRCVADWKCQWAADGEIGFCTETTCAKYGDAATCQLDVATCTTLRATGPSQCRVSKCYDVPSSCVCSTKSGCAWRDDMCSSTAMVDCSGMDTVYMIDANEEMAVEFSRYTTGFFGLTQLIAEADMSLTRQSADTPAMPSTPGARVGFVQYAGPAASVTPTGVGSAGRLSGSITEVLQDIAWHQQLFSGSLITREAAPGLNEAIRLFSGSQRSKYIVLFASGLISDADALAADKSNPQSTLARLQSMGINLIGVAIRTTEPMTDSGRQAIASLKLLTPNVTDMPLTDVTSLVLEGQCGSGPLTIGMYTTKKQSTVTCASLTTKNNCTRVSTCGWDTATMTCVNAGCLGYCSSSLCATDPTCVYSGSDCVQRCPTLSQSDCAANPTCAWMSADGFCGDAPCVANPTEDACIADSSGCTYNPRWDTPCQPTPCRYANESSCAADPSCAWSQGCFRNGCHGANQNDCSAMVQCEWHAQSSQCQLIVCGSHQSENTCQADRRCAWNVSGAPPVCGPARCRYLNVFPQGEAKSKCNADSACYWASPQESGYGVEMCIVKTCELLSTACACTAKDGCVWKNNSCKDTTFVQCPAIDVVFLVEATEYMGRTFERHPNGFIGVVESIRSWSWDAPLSPSVGNSGFRLGIVGYGSPTIALRANPAIGAKGNITANIQAWADVGGELDDFQRQQPAYAENVKSNVAIRKGLESALSLFKMNANANRRRMLIILGAQPITDGNDRFGSLIADVEALRIKIFSNVVRRFGSMTPLDRAAQAFLEPIASDPPSAHFLFASVDSLRESLLGAFCDPSTLTGEALGISRDGTLPCNWLNGETECQIQGSCFYNASALPTCPQSNQCPNLGCVALPPVLAKEFECKHCVVRSGAFECSRSKENPTLPGVCLASPCMTAHCTQSMCGADAACDWAGSSTRCERRMCTATTAATCNDDRGCVWIDAGTDPSVGSTGCYKSICGTLRESETCAALITQVGTSDTFPCAFVESLSPGICTQQRCPNLNQSSCGDFPAQCGYNSFSSSSQKCFDKQCQHTSNELCAADARCYWDPFVRIPGQLGTCKQRVTDCVVSGYSEWSPCTATCGNTSIRYKARTVLQFPSTGGLSCADVAATLGRTCQPPNSNCQPGDMTMLVSKTCTTQQGWEMDCSSHCGRMGSLDCASDVSCMWRSGMCAPRPFAGCESITTAAMCNSTDMCAWDESLAFCRTVVKVCRHDTEEECNVQAKCMWRTGSSANALAQSIGVSAQLINPGQKSIFVFPHVAVDGDTMIHGATIAIESNYQRQKDVLRLAYPAPINSSWIASSGTLLLTGTAPLTEYSAAVRFVIFETTSVRGLPRNITWSYGTRTVLSVITGHYYKYVPQPLTWDEATAACAASSHFGLQGYLATVTSAAENDVLSSTLMGEGWISGDDSTLDGWQLSTGPEKQEAFWRGGSSLVGGYSPPGAYANWNVLNGEPRTTDQGYSHPYLNVTGYWAAKSSSFDGAMGYFCEYGGMGDTVTANFAVAGATVIGVGGCVPSTSCGFHTDAINCGRDDECEWTGDQCISGCGVRASIAECERGVTSKCQWDATVLPPQCDINPCNGLGLTPCASHPRCRWDSARGCTALSGCQQFLDESTCAALSSCSWSFGNALCMDRPCASLRPQSVCVTNPLCGWSDSLGCFPVTCKYGTAGECQADSRCTWSESEESSVGFFAGSSSVLIFTDGVQAPNDITTQIDGITVAITEGFQRGSDVLSIDPSLNAAGDYVISYDALAGVLSIRVSPGVVVNALSGFRFLQAGVAFSSSSLSSQRRRVTYVLSLRTTPSHSMTTFFKLNTTRTSSYAEAKAVCEGSRLFNLWGRIASVTSQVDTLRLAGLGASGWIGAVANARAEWWWEGNATAYFWRGAGSKGRPVEGAYAQWAVGEPRAGMANAIVDTTHDFAGYFSTWRSSMSSVSSPHAAVCQFGDAMTPPTHVISGSRSVKPSGCFSVPCLGYPQAQCAASSQCVWQSLSPSETICVPDTWCTATTTASCNQREGCYWSYASGACRTAPSNFCRAQGAMTCGDFSQCRWDTSIIPRDPTQSGSCVVVDCGRYPTEDSCVADALCRWDASQRCADRLCGYFTDAQCWADVSCRWDYLSALCSPSPCFTNATACSVEPYCRQQEADCAYVRCAERTKAACLLDSACMFTTERGCYMPDCASALTEGSCTARKDCYYSFDPNQCLAAQCTVQTTSGECEQVEGGLRRCRWEAAQSTCRELTVVERYAPSAPAMCEVEVNRPPLWLLGIVAVVVVLLLLIMWRLYLAYARGMSIFVPRKQTVGYSPHQQYADELINETGDRDEDTNAPQRPTIHDL